MDEYVCLKEMFEAFPHLYIMFSFEYSVAKENSEHPVGSQHHFPKSRSYLEEECLMNIKEREASMPPQNFKVVEANC